MKREVKTGKRARHRIYRHESPKAAAIVVEEQLPNAQEAEPTPQQPP